MARMKDRFAQKAAQQFEVGGRILRVRRSAVRAGCDASYLRVSVQAFADTWQVEVDGRTRHTQNAAIKHKGLG